MIPMRLRYSAGASLLARADSPTESFGFRPGFFAWLFSARGFFRFAMAVGSAEGKFYWISKLLSGSCSRYQDGRTIGPGDPTVGR
jgi:hypothetical protein